MERWWAKVAPCFGVFIVEKDACTITVPPDLVTELKKNKKARAQRLEQFIGMLERGETIH